MTSSPPAEPGLAREASLEREGEQVLVEEVALPRRDVRDHKHKSHKSKHKKHKKHKHRHREKAEDTIASPPAAASPGADGGGTAALPVAEGPAAPPLDAAPPSHTRTLQQQHADNGAVSDPESGEIAGLPASHSPGACGPTGGSSPGARDPETCPGGLLADVDVESSRVPQHTARSDDVKASGATNGAAADDGDKQAQSPHREDNKRRSRSRDRDGEEASGRPKQASAPRDAERVRNRSRVRDDRDRSASRDTRTGNGARSSRYGSRGHAPLSPSRSLQPDRDKEEGRPKEEGHGNEEGGREKRRRDDDPSPRDRSRRRDDDESLRDRSRRRGDDRGDRHRGVNGGRSRSRDRRDRSADRRDRSGRSRERPISRDRSRGGGRDAGASGRGRSRGRDASLPPPPPRRRSRSRSAGRRRSRSPGRKRSRSPELRVDAEALVAQMEAALEGGAPAQDEEDRLIEERRRRRQEILAKHQRQQQQQQQQEQQQQQAPGSPGRSAPPASPGPSAAAQQQPAALEQQPAALEQQPAALEQQPAALEQQQQQGGGGGSRPPSRTAAGGAPMDTAAGDSSPSSVSSGAEDEAFGEEQLWQRQDAGGGADGAAESAMAGAVGEQRVGEAAVGGRDRDEELFAASERREREQALGARIGAQQLQQKGEGMAAGVSAPAAATQPKQAAAATRNGATAAAADLDMFDEDDAADDIFAATSPDVRAGAVAGSGAAKAGGVPGKGRALLDAYDDAEGYYNFQVGEVMDGQYEVMANVGKGVFSTVLRAKVLPTTDAATAAAGKGGRPAEVAIKVIRANDTMYRAGQLEKVILTKLAGADPEGRRHCVRMERTFEYRGHLCLVFEPLDMNLRELTRKYGRGVGLNIGAVRLYAAQLLQALYHMRNCGVVHADLKPDNMLVNAQRNVVKVCDFGSAMFDSEENELTPVLVSRYYRPPEVILGYKYGHPLDMWSLGCVLYELFTGRILFAGRENNEMLKLMMDAKGPFPKKMLKKGAFTREHFEGAGAADYVFAFADVDPVSAREIRRMVPNPMVQKDLAARLAGSEGDKAKVAQLSDLLERMLALDPEKRITPKDALRHPFIREHGQQQRQHAARGGGGGGRPPAGKAKPKA